MELKFLWIEDYKNLKNFQINFSNSERQKFNYNNKTLHQLSEKDSIEGKFFGTNISSITAIVGENGSGKTNLSEFIRLHIAHFSGGSMSGWTNKIIKTIIVLGDHIELHESIKLKNLKKLGDLGFKISIYKEMPFESVMSDYNDKEGLHNPIYTLIYYSNIFDQRETFELQNATDISTNHLVGTDAYSFRFNETINYWHRKPINFLHHFFAMENNRIADLLFETNFTSPFVTHLKYFDLTLNSSADNKYLSFRSNANPPDKNSIRFQYYMGVENELHLHISTPTKNNNYSITALNYKYAFKKLFLLNILRAYENRDFESIIYLSDEFVKEYLDLNNLMIPEQYSNDQGNLVKIRSELEIFISLIDWQEQFFSVLDVSDNIIDKSLIAISSIDLELKNSDTFDFIKSFFNLINNTIKGIALFNFNSTIPICDYSFGNSFSSGEKSMLSFFGRLNYALKKIKTRSTWHEIKNITLFIDEGDIAFHPEWQRKFFSDSLVYLTEWYKEFKLQIILTTHSPFILSDVPESNVIFLKKEESTGNASILNKSIQKTFAANIHSLFTNAFFLSNTVGEFASEKIQTAIEIIQSQDLNRKAEAIQIVEMIGDDLIRESLKELIKETFFDESDIDLTIERLQTELKNAKAKKRSSK